MTVPHHNSEPLRIGVLVSGTGTNLQAILDRIAEGRLEAAVVLVVSNNSTSGALERAQKAGIKAVHWSEKGAGSVERFAEELIAMLKAAGVELVVLAGYMKLVPETVVAAFPGRMINIHPALLPKFGGKGYYGTRVHEAVLEAGETESGATVHFVDKEYDRGPILMQRKIPVRPEDTPETLRARVLAVEHELLPDAIAHFAEMQRQKQTNNP